MRAIALDHNGAREPASAAGMENPSWTWKVVRPFVRHWSPLIVSHIRAESRQSGSNKCAVHFFFFFYRRASIGRFRGTCNSSRTYWSRLKKKFFLPIWELISRRIKELAEVAIRQTNKSQLSARTRLLYSDISWHLRAHRLIVGRVLSEESMSDSNSWLSAGSHDLHYSAEKGFSDLSSFSPSAKGISARLRQRINLQLPFNLFRRLREAQASLAVLFEVVRLGTWLSIRMHFFFWWYK